MRFSSNHILFLILVLCSAQTLGESLTEQIQRGRSEVEEFVGIREIAEELGVRVWLFGGTASAYAHYEKWRGANARSGALSPQRFDGDWLSVFWSTQDADLVIDGTVEEASKLESVLKNRFPHLQGGKVKWEVRTLSHHRGQNAPILDNPDFLNQRSDSHSLGLVELTDPPKGESIVRDLSQWNSKNPRFLKNVTEGKLEYHDPGKHETTSRFQQGMNPPILSVIRYLIKMHQFGLRPKRGDLKKLREVIHGFDPRGSFDPYVVRWMGKNVPKIVTNSIDLERSFQTLESLGLLEKLKTFATIHGHSDMAAWLTKVPLTRTEVGVGEGRTAEELGFSKVTHATTNYFAFQSIRKSLTGHPNAIVTEGEFHRHGFYTFPGDQGLIGGKRVYQISFKVNPNAREGHDFVLYGNGEKPEIIWKNANALEVIYENFDLGLKEWIDWISQPEAFRGYEDNGVLETYFFRQLRKLGQWPGELRNRFIQLMEAEVRKEQPRERLVKLWFSSPSSREHPRVAQFFLENPSSEAAVLFFDSIANQPHWKSDPVVTDRMELHFQRALAAGSSFRETQNAKTVLWHLFDSGFMDQPGVSRRYFDAVLKERRFQHEFGRLIMPRVSPTRWKGVIGVVEKLVMEGHWSNGNTFMNYLFQPGVGGPDRHIHAEWIRHPGTIDILLKLVRENKAVGTRGARSAFSERLANPPKYLKNYTPITENPRYGELERALEIETCEGWFRGI